MVLLFIFLTYLTYNCFILLVYCRFYCFGSVFYFVNICNIYLFLFFNLFCYQTDRYFIDRKKVNPDLFVIELEICTCIYNIVNLVKSYDNIHSMTYITKIMLTGIAIRNTGYVL